MSELKPCPFCGETQELQTVARDWYRLKHPHVVECPLDELELTYPQTDDQLQYLTGDWNRRAVPADQVLVPRNILERAVEIMECNDPGQSITKALRTLLHP